jgi:hypothetical protein
MAMIVNPAESATTAVNLLQQWLAPAVPAEGAQWLRAEIERQRDSLDDRRLGIALGLCPRRVGRADLALSEHDVVTAQALRPRWRPDTWSSDEAARIALLLATWRGDEAAFATLIERVCETAELGELVASLKGFAVFPAAESLYPRAREAIRSSVQPVFEAIACDNPYPADYFEDPAYNQMVVKCVFTGVPIEKIVGLDQRRNAALLSMLRDLVSERHAAARAVPVSVLQWIGENAHCGK